MSRFRFPPRPSEDDEVVIEKVPRAVLARSIRKARSLRFGSKGIEAAARGDREAMAIRDAWRPSWKVKVLSPAGYAALVSRSEGVTYHD